MSIHMSGFQSFSIFLHHFVSAKLVTSSIGVNDQYTSRCITTALTMAPPSGVL